MAKKPKLKLGFNFPSLIAPALNKTVATLAKRPNRPPNPFVPPTAPPTSWLQAKAVPAYKPIKVPSIDVSKPRVFNALNPEPLKRAIGSQIGVSSYKAPANIPGNVSTLQKFLATFGGQALYETGKYDQATKAAYQRVLSRSRDISLQAGVRKAQEQYKVQKVADAAAARKQIAGHIANISQSPFEKVIAKYGDQLDAGHIKQLRRAYESGTSAAVTTAAGTPEGPGSPFYKAANELARLQQTNNEAGAYGVNDKNRQAVARTLYRTYATGSDAEIIRLANNLNKKKAEADSGILGEIFHGIEVITEPFQRMYYAGKYAEGQGGDLWDQTVAFWGAAPGLGFIAGGSEDNKVRRWIEAVNSSEERSLLRRAGHLASAGEYVTGEATSVLRGQARKRYLDAFAIGTGGLGTRAEVMHRDRTSGVFKSVLGVDTEKIASSVTDVAFQIFADPSTYVSFGLTKFGGVEFLKESTGAVKAATEAVAAARAAGLAEEAIAGVANKAASAWVYTNTNLGQFVVRGVDRALGETAIINKLADPEGVQKVFRGLPWGNAVEVTDALMAKNGGKEAVRKILLDALISGDWSPELAPFRGVLRGTLGLGSAGRDVVRDSPLVSKFFGGKSLADTIRSIANTKKDLVAVANTADPEKFFDQAIPSVLSHAEEGTASTLKEALEKAPKIKGNQWNRATELLAYSDKIQEHNPGFAAYIQQRIRPLLVKTRKGLHVGIDVKAFASGAGPAYQSLGKVLRELELIQQILRVDKPLLGERAAKQMMHELNFGFRAYKTSLPRTIGMAAQNIGLSIAKPGRIKFDKSAFFAMGENVSDPVWLQLHDEYARLAKQVELGGAKAGKAKVALGNLQYRLQVLAEHPSLREEVDRLVNLEKNRLGWQAGGYVTSRTEHAMLKGLGIAQEDLQDPTMRLFKDALRDRGARKGLVHTKSGLARLVLSAMESAPPARIALQRFASIMLSDKERVEFIDRLAASYGLDDSLRSAIRRQAASVRTEKDLYNLIEVVPRAYARQYNLPEGLVNKLLAAKRGEMDRSLAFAVNEDGTLANHTFTVAQNIETAPVMQKTELQQALRAELDKFGLGEAPGIGDKVSLLGTKLRVDISNVANAEIKWIPGGSIKAGLESGHRLWKFMVVTNAYMPVVGVVAGLVSGNMNYALAGAALGGLGSIRYVARVPGIDENLRYIMERGANPEELIPVYSRAAAERRVLENPFVNYDAVKASGFRGQVFENRWMAIVDPDWGVLSRGHSGYIHGWDRIVNHQLQPEVYRVDWLALNRKAGNITEEAYQQQLKQLAKSEAGKQWLARFKGALRGPKNWDEAVARTEGFVDQYVPPSIARARLRGEVSKTDFRDSIKFGDAPEVVHAQKSWVLPKTPKQLYRRYVDAIGAFAFEGPTNLNRNRMARWVYADEYSKRVAMGIDPEKAAEQATEIAVDKTNKIMFRIDGESRFARKVDWVFPFQQPREEFLRVWLPLVAKHPGRMLRVSHLAARAFNNGAEEGIFYKDNYGEWSMTIPGSAWLSDKLFGYDYQFDFNLRDLNMFAQGGALGGVSILPVPGGPYWTYVGRALVDQFPSIFEKGGVVKDWLFPYGPGRGLVRNETRFLWWAFTDKTPPWDLYFEHEADNEHNRYTIEIARQMIADHIAKGGDANWIPPDDQLKDAVRQFYEARSFWGSIWPAVPRPVLRTREKFNKLTDLWTLGGKTKLNSEEFLKAFPEFSPYLLPTSKYVGPQDMEHWKAAGANTQNVLTETALRWRETISYDEFKDEFKQYAKDQEVYAERRRAFESQKRDNGKALLDWEKKHPEYVDRFRNAYYRDLDLAYILTVYPKQQRDLAIENWKQRYGVTYQQYLADKEKVLTTFRVDPWREARAVTDVVRDVKNAVHHGQNEAAYVATLQPAEQYKFWNNKIWDLNESWTPEGDQQEMDRLYKQYRDNKNQLFSNYPELVAFNNSRKTAYEKNVASIRGYTRATLSALYAEVNRTTDAMNTAYGNKDWSSYNSLNEKRTNVYNTIRAINDDFFRKYPDLTEIARDAMAMVDAKRGKNYAKVQQLNLKLQKDWRKASGGSVEFIPTDEQAGYLNRPPHLRKVYINDLVSSLGLPNLRGITKQYPGLLDVLHEHGLSKVYWDWLTEFQKSLLERHMPPDYINVWKQEKPTTKGVFGRGHGGHGFGHSTGDPGLDWAFSLLHTYNQRPKGAKAPAAYAEYLALPRNPALRSAFLRDHPEVREWISQGPMANMPPLYQLLVANIMIAAGRWDGEELPIEEVTDIAFARQQLDYWSRRGDMVRPDTYDTWLAMPSGAAKVAYLQEHPEVQDWIRLGPMANMPDTYKEVIRDIMFRYGLWTQEVSDTLGETIQGYFRTPAYARQQYLQDHPELLAYWSLTKGPEELGMFDLSNQYFSIGDVNAKRAFLQSHPELSQWFIDQRTRRYQRFIDQVARFMGSNPDLFTSYLDRQNEILADLLRRFGEPPLLVERAYLKPTNPTKPRVRS